MPDNTSLYVVLDANILIRDFWMSGRSFSYLLMHQFLDHRPIIPEVAYLEARSNLKRRAETLLSNRSSNGDGSQGNTHKLLRLFNYKRVPSNAKWHIDTLLKRWDKHITGILKHFGGQMLPSPQVNIKEIVQRSIERKKPFSNGDRGFRDTIIWLSALDLIGPESRVSFVTSNTQDFFQANSSEPHPEILTEAKKKLGKHCKMLFHRSLDEFIAKFDSDHSASSATLQRALISNTLSGFDLWNWLVENLLKIVGDDDFDGVNWAGLPYDAEAPVLVDVEELIAVDIPRTSHLIEDTYRLYCDVAFIGHFGCDIAFSKAETVVNPNQILWKDEADSIWTSIVVRAAATFIVRIDFDVRTRTVIECFARPLVHWESYDEAIDDLESRYEEINGEGDDEYTV
jgi:PIN domain-containing protein